MEATSKTDASRINGIFELQKSNSELLRVQPLQIRIERLEKLKDWIQNHRENIQQALMQDFKKPAPETDLSEIYAVLSEIKHATKNIHHWVAPQKVGSTVALLGSKSYVHHEPKGVCLIISPWNFPFSLTIGPLVSALAAGNTVIIKPSELSPNCSQLIAGMVSELFESNQVAVFPGDRGIARHLLELPFDHIFFTGSPGIGKIVMESAAKHLTSITLELGGKSPAIIDSSADIEDAAEKLVWGKFMNCGQTCIAPDYLLVHKSIQERLLEHLGRFIDKFYNPDGAGVEASDSYARIINNSHFDRLHNLLLDALESGAEIEYGGNLVGPDRFITPTIISNVSPQSRIMQEEIFGPILPVIGFQKYPEIVQFIKNRPKPLALYIFSRSAGFKDQLLSEISSGSVAVNDNLIQFMNPNLPFGGVNFSGFGKSHGYSGFQAFSNQKSVLRQKTGLTSVKPLYPPYTNLTRRAIDFLLKYL